MSAPFDLVLGRKTYDILAAYWPHAPEEAGAKPLNDATKYVAKPSHASVEQLGPDRGRRDRKHRSAQEGRRARAVGAWQRKQIQTLMRHNLVDQYRLLIFPVVIGAGKRLFSEGTSPSGLKLVDSKVSTTGVVMGTYEPAGEIVTGSLAVD
jgi:dihydrofolate reductase